MISQGASKVILDLWHKMKNENRNFSYDLKKKFSVEPAGEYLLSSKWQRSWRVCKSPPYRVLLMLLRTRNQLTICWMVVLRNWWLLDKLVRHQNKNPNLLAPRKGSAHKFHLLVIISVRTHPFFGPMCSLN